MAAGFAWISSRFPEARLSANIIGVVYIGALAGLGAGLGALLTQVLRREVPRGGTG
jgi:hypothetical protein